MLTIIVDGVRFNVSDKDKGNAARFVNEALFGKAPVSAR